MNCQEALDLLYDIIDKEASEVDSKKVQEHLRNCKHCFEIYKVEGAVQEFISAKLANDQQAGPKLDALKSKILTQLDDIDKSKKDRGSRGKPPFWNLSFTMAIAAFVVITLGAAYLFAGLSRHQQLYAPLEKAHWSAKIETLTPGDTNATLTLARTAMKYALEPDVSGYVLAGGHMENVAGTQMAHFIYRQGETLVSVFVAPSSQFAIPENLRSALVHQNNIDFYDHHCRGCRLVYHRAGDAVVVTASSDHTVDLLNFVPGHVAI